MQYLTYISINVSNINQFHLQTSELILSENKTLTKTLPNSRGDNFNNTLNRVIILALCSTLHIYLVMFQVSINSIKTSELLSENKTLTKTFNLIVEAA